MLNFDKTFIRTSQMWYKYLPLATFAHNTFNSPHLANHSPYELVFGKKTEITIRLGDGSRRESFRNTQRIFASLKKKIRISTQTLTGIRMRRLALINKDRDNLVYIISPLTNQLRTALKESSIKYIGPLAVYKIVDPHNYLLMTLDGNY